MKREIDDQKNILSDKKEQNYQLSEEHICQRSQLNFRMQEISKYKAEMEQQKIISEQLLFTCNKYKSEHQEVTAKNDGEGGEIEEILYKMQVQEQETGHLNAQMESYEYSIGQQMEEIEHLNSIVEEKTQYEADKNAEFLESEASINKVKE